MKITINNRVIESDNPIRIREIIDDPDYKYMVAKVNNRIRELNYRIPYDATVELLDLTDVRAMKIYDATLRYVVAMAAKRLFPKARIYFNYSISRSVFAGFSGFGRPFTMEDLQELEKEVKTIISADLTLVRKKMSLEEAIKVYKKQGFTDKIKVLEYRKDEIGMMYECDGFYDYMYDFMLPSTGYLKKFEFKYYSPGFLILYPRAECNGEIPPFEDEKVFREVIREANSWGNILKINTIAQLNDTVHDGRALELINICETRHNNQLADLGKKICKEIERTRLVCVAGPSSSGKTTFTNRLRIELLARGVEPILISMDDFYFTNVEEYPKDEFGKPDYEHLNALDLDLFDSVIYKLINGEKVKLPRFDFKTKKRTFTKAIRINSKQPILVEGIHALDDAICPSVPQEQKFKIFIAPLAQYGLDDHTPISLSDMRLIRRIVRDKQFRNTGCESTLALWQSVRAGEFRWIYKYQNNADSVFNSELAYEPLVLAKYAIPVLDEVPEESPQFVTASRLKRFLKYYESISDKWIPCNSILREFVGGSIFYTDDKK